MRWFVERAIKNLQRSDKPLRKTLKSDFFPKNEAGSLSWALLNKLALSNTSPPLLTIKPKKNYYDVEWNGASVYCPQQGIEQLVDWLDYVVDDSLSFWQRDLDEHLLSNEPANFDLDFLKSKSIRFSGKTNVEVIQRFSDLANGNAVDKTIRELSAKYFWGDSKFLESLSGDWLSKVLPQLNVKDRKIQVNFYLPKHYERVLFVENLDSYEQLIHKQPACAQNFAIVYASGFRLSAARIRDYKSASLHQSVQSAGASHNFITWWLKSEDVTLPCFFWGDFDFSAMGILKALRTSFLDMQLWQPGYQAMKKQVEAGRGHAVSLRDKQAQIDPGQTGCEYADDVILPLLRDLQFCFDQEGIDFETNRLTQGAFDSQSVP